MDLFCRLGPRPIQGFGDGRLSLARRLLIAELLDDSKNLRGLGEGDPPLRACAVRTRLDKIFLWLGSNFRDFTNWNTAKYRTDDSPRGPAVDARFSTGFATPAEF